MKYHPTHVYKRKKFPDERGGGGGAPHSRAQKTPVTVVIRAHHFFFFNTCAQFYFFKVLSSKFKESVDNYSVKGTGKLKLLKVSRGCVISDSDLGILLVMSLKSADMSSENCWTRRCH